MTDNELLLLDRIQVIKSIDNLNEKGYLSFSGGKDSTVLHYLLDLALPNNTIPRVYMDTGIEYNDVRQFVKDLAKNDNRFVIIKPSKNIREILNIYGYPFKSKEYSDKLSTYQHSGMTPMINRYLGNGDKIYFLCPKKLRYQFREDFTLKVSKRCCDKLKKETAKHYVKDSGRTITITGMRLSEGGLRQTHRNNGCVFKDKENNIIKFHPLFPISDEWENWFIKENNIKLCKLYYPPYNFKRTGCRGCPYNLNLQKDLDIMKELLPFEYKSCEIIWKPVYDEYRKLGYRLRKEK